ncbi:hypothetical protein NZD89_23175 [Alicyclobacillus fastidiosus]|uniref:Uncharacterized protein n=1 Tax=Alicyclobacillus fastidiosus TaxID=392011 RepID=A0ABY6ZE15_9BACL|nr:hypothetical protein [Alicyclobacillus fastidiosus]WAH41138.1 hypothetical protein NZD89_23175 [Alicyclobacillus fastidiosus]GMA62700.1 hypothetical protein GCM10025859_31400 [Alicyclobacillus fastidiosus]
MRAIEYVGRIADIGEFIPVLAADRLEAMRQFSDVALDSLYMESQSPSTVPDQDSAYEYHLVKLRNGAFYLLEDDPTPSFDHSQIEKYYIGVPLT